MRLRELLVPFVRVRVIGEGNPEITAVTADSREVTPGALFVALRGYTVDGHQYVEDAVRAGASAVVVETELPGLPVPQVVLPDTRAASAKLATVFYGFPSNRLSVVGVTGTNGKTTTTQLIARILETRGATVGVIGTIGKRVGEQTTELTNTTPDAIALQKMLAEMVHAKCSHVVMEASSHALEEGRLAGTRFQTAVFTNLTQDHLDFHGTMEAYKAAKAKLFSRLGNQFPDNLEQCPVAVLNADDEASDDYRRQTVQEVLTYGILQLADVMAKDVLVRAEGVSFRVESFAGEADVHLQLTGRFNVYNALAALTTALSLRIPLADAAAALETVAGVAGRFERVVAGQDFTVLVDYSHTPDSLENALQTVREFAEARVFTVVGCGGDRDRTKRPIMAKIAGDYSDLVILTSDNPRTEDPERILDDMEAGINVPHERLVDRKTAIARAVSLASAKDVVLIAGKGHETYQILGRTKIHFDDREEARAAILAKRQDA
ncbi:UDP-N-acetylmuramoyl-L-alanyl-D-glutamate--2,6-diaminopimelate ligase [Alicyclobacillus sp. SP_1]|uniref:UDP-N-acetylmuramoyl-L-alanyl-D-glutamate--2, 6-diaminopimelate ligase n=1 Tax=Alicyclobacillus sp. SP_1 TaxID=2942475 RepID=UPI0021571F20|nr:UDP-N-acetylmuramoyl-L-alanyl-D-glutamate--2,6-diaminopimelate ligase [Alicyclobacillus sp. SP_1]